MTYNPNIPQANDDPTQSQLQLLNNFAQINTQFSVNHVPLTAGGQNGFHTQVVFNNVLSVDPNPTAPSSVLYTKTSTTGTVPTNTTELFFQNGPLAANVKQLTQLPITKAAPSNFGFTTPWGMIVNCGLQTTGVSPITFQVPYPVGFNTYTALVTPQNAAVAISVVVSVTQTQLTFVVSPAATPIYYLVIGSS
jgi:hypothetical protein